MKETFDLFIKHYVRKAAKEHSSIEIDSNYNWVLESSLPEIDRIDTVHKGLKELYTEKANGFELWWYKNKKADRNALKFVEAKHIIGNWGFDDQDIEENETIQYFKPFDLFSSDAEVGFISTPDKVFSSVYYRDAGSTDLSNLDLDFNGYCQMAVEARIFFYWQLVLLNISNPNTGVEETKKFKKEMPEIFSDWSWENFVAKYEKLRLSNKR